MGIKGAGDMLTKEQIEQARACAGDATVVALCDMALAHLKACEQEPVAFYTHDFKGKDHGNLCMWGKDIPERIKFKESSGHQWMPLYAAPVPEKLLQAQDQKPVAWIDGVPPHPYDKEWFIALTIWGDKVVIQALPPEYTYDYKTADDTYFLRSEIKCWMQFPDSKFKPFAAPVPALSPWVKCSERLPTDNEDYLVRMKRNDGSWYFDQTRLNPVRTEFYVEYDRLGEHPVETATHWMPLPKSPEEK
jgi:hypothetical protein